MSPVGGDQLTCALKPSKLCTAVGGGTEFGAAWSGSARKEKHVREQLIMKYTNKTINNDTNITEKKHIFGDYLSACKIKV